jgi:hypothetical protein
MSTAHHRARAAILSRYRDPDDRELSSARQKLAEETLVAAVRRALDAAPPLTPEVRTRIVGLLTPADNGELLFSADTSGDVLAVGLQA